MKKEGYYDQHKFVLCLHQVGPAFVQHGNPMGAQGGVEGKHGEPHRGASYFLQRGGWPPLGIRTSKTAQSLVADYQKERPLVPLACWDILAAESLGTYYYNEKPGF